MNTEIGLAVVLLFLLLLVAPQVLMIPFIGIAMIIEAIRGTTRKGG